MALSKLGPALYRNVTRRFSTLFLAAVVGAFAFDLVLNRGTDFYWDMLFDKVYTAFLIKNIAQNMPRWVIPIVLDSQSKSNDHR
ncbi:unnamed protein product [Toxocara canis]|uniref:Lipoprotein signal peptidase n=1 Tax=Toxocara canis TaxID=6265 RepID=A0A183VC40_TOXCA|nr:unnamed protein product [Toxocara canis]